LNCLSVLQFAIDILKVRHVLVVGHYGCAGVAAALANRRIGLVDNWLRHIQDIYHKHAAYVESQPPDTRADRLCELNVIEQVVNVCQTTIVQEAWHRGQMLYVHGWTYGLQDGLLRDLKLTIASDVEIVPAYQRAVNHMHQGSGKIIG